ncbi:MAG: oligosaccharide flippase family protein, partial [Burkholderiales bacterium]|nr:oligosaccharide flippase family protein [Burkholderiales bacterium]
MLKNFIKHSMIYTLASLFNRGIAFVLLPILTRYLTPQEYGALDFIIITATFVTLFCGLEMHQGISRFMVDFKSDREKSEAFSTVIFYI